jgi:uncharacterized protein (UPF0548 family)
MDVLLLGRRPRLESWEARGFAAGAALGAREGDRRDAYEREVGREPPGAPVGEGPFRRAAAAILRFDVFEPSRIAPVIRRAPLAVGDTVGICYRFAPGVALFFASRVIRRFDEERQDMLVRTGFEYRTLAGHPELGEETFSVEKDIATGAVTVALRSWSRPGLPVTRAFAPLLRSIQVGASHGALDHLARIAGG